jgi:hypothetical protein
MELPVLPHPVGSRPYFRQITDAHLLSQILESKPAFILVAIVLSLLAQDAMGGMSEDKCRTLVVGKWKQTYEKDGVRTSWTTTFLSSGQYHQDGVVVKNSISVPVRTSGNWTISKDKITFEVESSTTRSIPVGSRVTDTLVRITSREFVYELQGERVLKIRISTPTPEQVSLDHACQ